MSKEAPTDAPNAASESPLSLSRLRDAFAAMLKPAASSGSAKEKDVRQTAAAPHSPSPTCEVNPRSVIEAMLFVGRPDNGAISPRELAAAMRGVSPGEVEAAVEELNSLYDADHAPYYIERGSAGFRLVLREEYARMRDKMYGRIREAKLSPAALEVLSMVAYRQPITAEEINELRGAASGSALSLLVRRRLVRLERPDGGRPLYSTTERFLKVFNLESLDALPRSEELEKV